MINWLAVKQASISLSPIPVDIDSTTPYSEEDKKLLSDMERMAMEASNEELTDDDLAWELNNVAMQGTPFRIMKDGKPIGGAVLSRFSHYDDKVKRNYDGQSIRSLAIYPEYRDKGVGREAITLLMKEALKKKPKWLHIAHANSNQRAAHLYTSMGFGLPTPWDDKATSLHMKAKDAIRMLKENNNA